MIRHAQRAFVVLLFVLGCANAQAQGTQMLPDFTELVEKFGPAVVNIRTVARVSASQAAPGLPDLDENDPLNEFFRRFFPQPGPQ